MPGPGPDQAGSVQQLVGASCQRDVLRVGGVKRFTEGHGGKVTVQSVPGEGSLFTVVLPARPQQTGEGAVLVVPPLPEPDRF